MSERKHASQRGGKHLMKRDSWLSRYKTWKATLDPVRRKRQRIFEVLGLTLVGLLVLWGIYSWVFGASGLRPNFRTPGLGESTTTIATDSGRKSGVYTLLVAGKDTGGGGNTDTMILVSFDTRAKKINAISLPRDTMINVSWRTKKLNTVYNYHKGKDKNTQVENGMSGLCTYVGKLTGILPDYYVVVEWDAVGELVDALGGVTFNVPYTMDYDDPAQDLHIHQAKGERLLSGEDAMQVIRWRKNNSGKGIGDSGRMEIQQGFLMAVARECLQLKHVANIPAFAKIFQENVTTDLSVGNLVWLAEKAVGMNVEEDIRFYTMPYENYSRGTAYVLPKVPELLAILNDGINPYKRDIVSSDLETFYKNNGKLTLTSGTLADSSLGKVPVFATEETAQAPEPTQTDAPKKDIATTPQPEPEVEVTPETKPEPEIEQENQPDTQEQPEIEPGPEVFEEAPPETGTEEDPQPDTLPENDPELELPPDNQPEPEEGPEEDMVQTAQEQEGRKTYDDLF